MAASAIFISFLFLLTTYYLSQTSYIDFKMWDVDTVTAADFTVEYQIPAKVWEDFLKLPEANHHDSKATAFENYLRTEFEKIVTL